MAAVPVQHIDQSVFGGLNEGVYHLALMSDGDQVGGAGDVAVPELMMDGLKIPFHFPRLRVQGDDTVGEEVDAGPVSAVEVGGGGAGAEIDEASLFIYRHSTPVIGRSDLFIRVFWPGIIAEFSRLRHGVEGPQQLAGDHVESPDMPGGGVAGFAYAGSDDEDIFIDDSRSTGRHR